MLLNLYCSSRVPARHQHATASANSGFENVHYALWLLSRSGIEVEIIDTAYMTNDQIQAAYEVAQIPAVARKMGVRLIFGTKYKSGFRFGKEVPALLVLQNPADYPVHVFPCYEKDKNRETAYKFDVFPILQYLTYVLEKHGYKRRNESELQHVSRAKWITE